MSELRFSGQLVEELLNTLVQHDDRAQDDSVSAQYLSGTIGFLLGREDRLTRDQKLEILRELYGFAERVIDDVESQRQPQEPQPAAPAAEAEGVWRPGMD